MDTHVSTKTMTSAEIRDRLIRRATGGTHVVTMSPPALSTEFVKSQHSKRAYPGEEGSLSRITVPSWPDVMDRNERKHGDKNVLGYKQTLGSDGYPAGYGERSAKALQREENTYQLKGKFPAATLAFAKLKARVEARHGDVTAVTRVFASFWHLTEDQVNMLPNLHLSGSECSRLAAMEDRAYHAVAGHPGHSGGFRVDMATLAPDALGEDIPLAWPRLRTSLKAIAMIQTQADMELEREMSRVRVTKEFSFGMDLTVGSQRRYQRPYPWETLIDRIILKGHREVAGSQFAVPTEDLDFQIRSTFIDDFFQRVVDRDDLQLTTHIRAIASMVVHDSNQALERTIAVILAHDRERATQEEGYHDDFDALDDADLSTSFTVPRYKLTRSSLQKGLRRAEQQADRLPDITTKGTPKLMLDLQEFREAHLSMPIDIAGALNLAVYITVMHPHTQPAAYMLMAIVKSPESKQGKPASERFRSEKLYSDGAIRCLGAELFSDVFMNTFEMLLKNMSTPQYRNEIVVKSALWDYLSNRCASRRACPVPGSWRDLIIELRTITEGWSLYYWVRITIGRRHKAVSSSILMPIAAGEPVDFLTVVRKGIRERIKSWSSFYAAKYKAFEGRIAARKKMEALRKGRKLGTDTLGNCDDIAGDAPPIRSTKYVPPQMRPLLSAEKYADRDIKQTGGFREEEYMLMVEAQSKMKFFSKIEVSTYDRQIAVGMPDESMLEMLVDFYQARWYSLHKRIERAKARTPPRPFRLGPHVFHEHPWPPVLERDQLPDNVQAMLRFMSGLDARAWTISPSFLQEKFVKSISELWDDVSNEINQVLEFIREIHDDVAEEQECTLTSRHRSSVMSGLSDVKAIDIPVYGYRAPSRLPSRSITYTTEVDGESTDKTIRTAPATFVDPTATTEEPLDDPLEDNELRDDDDGDDDIASYSMLSSKQQVVEASGISATYISLRKIWHVLGLPEVSDAEVKHAIGIPGWVDLDVEHVDALIGPTHLLGEENRVARSWSNKIGMIKRRLNMGLGEAVKDDM